MDDKQILNEVYYKLNVGRPHEEMIDFIRQEWQREDEIEAELDEIETQERGKKTKK